MGKAKVAGLQHWRYHVPALSLPLRGSSQQSLVSEKAAQSSVTPDQTRAISAHHGCLSCESHSALWDFPMDASVKRQF